MVSSMNLTDREWKEFYIKDIFNHVERGKRLTKEAHTTGTIRECKIECVS